MANALLFCIPEHVMKKPFLSLWISLCTTKVWNKASLSDGENKWQGARSIASVSIMYLAASTVNNPGTAIKWAEYFPFW